MISRRSLEIRFRKAVGRTVHEELERIRLERAKRLLLETDHPITRVAEAAGFASPSYLRRSFAATFGVTPARYRRQGRTPSQCVSTISRNSVLIGFSPINEPVHFVSRLSSTCVAWPGDRKIRWVAGRKSFVLGLEDVRHERLRVAVDQGEPGALDLHHDLVPLLEAVIVPVQVDRVFLDRGRARSARASRSSCGSGRGRPRRRS